MSDTPRAPHGRSSASPRPVDRPRDRLLLDDDDDDMDYVPAESGDEAESLDEELDDGDFHGTHPVAARPCLPSG